MLRIRLQRTGNKNNPTYRIVVADKRNAAKGKFTEIIGHYLPTRKPAEFECDQDRVSHWMGLGAIPTDTMARLLSKAGMKGLEKFTERYTKQKKKNPSEEEQAAAAPAPAEEVKEEKKEEAPKEAPAEESKEEEKKEEAPSEEKKKEEPVAEETKEEVKDDKEKKDA